MTVTDSSLGSGVTVLAALAALPILGMTVVTALLALTGGGHPATGVGGPARFLLPLIPLTVFVGLGYLLYRGISAERSGRTGNERDELRAAYARGDRSDEEFENRRSRLQAADGGSTRTEVSSNE